MRRFSLQSLVLTLVASLALWAMVAAGCMMIGSGEMGWPRQAGIVQIRAQYVLTASLIGAALAVAGVAYQAILKNPLADPFLLGVSSGASLAAYLWRMPGLAGAAVLGALSQQTLAFAGALASVAIVFALASRRGRLEPVTLLLVGVIVNAINGSIFLLVNALWPEVFAQGGSPLGFLVGGIQTNLESYQIATAAGVSLVAMILLMAVAPQLNVASLSEAEARALGVRIHRLRWLGMIGASLMTASVVAISGPIGFVGLVCPHLARLIVGHDTRRLLPLSAGLGAALLALADALSRHLITIVKTWPPVGVLTGLLGGPFFLWLLYRQGKEQKG